MLYFYLEDAGNLYGFLDRFLACCEAYNIPTLILFNKMDILNEEENTINQNIQEIYQKIGYETMEISSYSMLNFESLKNKIKGVTSVFLGIQEAENLRL